MDHIVQGLFNYISGHGTELAGIVVSTWVGASAAFRFERWARNRERKMEELKDGKRAQLALIGQYEFIKQLDCEYLQPSRDDPERWRNLHAVALFSFPQQVDRATLGYLLDADPGLLHQLGIHEHSIMGALGSFKERSAAHERLQKKVGELSAEAVPVPNFDDPAGRALAEEMIGLDIVDRLKGLTDSLYSAVDHALVSTRDNYARLTNTLDGYFSRKKLLPGNALQQVDDDWARFRRPPL